jgi:xanthine dehydrogenase small subunit
MLRFALNDKPVAITAPHGLPALDYLREGAGLTGVKHACREGDCGSCVILLGQPKPDGLNYRVVTSCLLPLGAIDGHHVVTIEGLNGVGLGPFQQALVNEGGSQCGFCTPGFVVSFIGFLLSGERWELTPAIEAVAGNICRCTGYSSIVRAMASILARLCDNVDPAEPRIAALVREGVLPAYFLHANEMLRGFQVTSSPKPPQPSQVIISGGTDLYVQRPDELDEVDVFVMPATSKSSIRLEGEHVYLEGATTAEDLKTSSLLAERVGDLAGAMTLMGSLPIRHRATIAGNIVNASPIGDMTIVLLALDAEIGLIGGRKRRAMPLREFFLDYKKLDLRPGELVEWVRFPADRNGHFFNFEKVSRRTHLDIASVNTAISLSLDDGRIAEACLAAGGVAPIPKQLPRTAEYLCGHEPTAETALGAAAVARSEVAPISDVRGSAEYKSLLLGQLVLAHFNALFGVEDGLVKEATG